MPPKNLINKNLKKRTDTSKLSQRHKKVQKIY